MTAALGSQYGATIAAAEKSDSPAPLTGKTYYAEMRKLKNPTRNRNFKSKISLSICVGTSDHSNDTTTHTTKSCDTIPLNVIVEL
jgi:hypothetical protein